MNEKQAIILITIFTFMIIFASCSNNQHEADKISTRMKDEMIEELGISATELINLRGFKAVDYFFTTKDGYILNIIKATNPLINGGSSGLENKTVILFVHGTITNAKCFILKSAGAYPADYSNYDASKMTKVEIDILIGDNNSRFSVVFTALNFGHEVWLLNRRGNQYSQGHIDPHRQAFLNKTYKDVMDKFEKNSTFEQENLLSSIMNMSDNDKEKLKSNFEKLATLINNNENNNFTINNDNRNILLDNPISNIIEILTKPLLNFNGIENTFNPKYWDFSLDEHALIDFVESVDFVRKMTGRDKISVVGHSAGGAITLMALSVNKPLNDKLLKTILWAPALDLGGSNRLSLIESVIAPLVLIPFTIYIGGIPPTLIVPLIQSIAAIICSNTLTQIVICIPIFDFLFGLGGSQTTLVSGDLTALFDSVSSHELAHLAEFTRTTKSRMFDFISISKNVDRYGTTKPPAYNLSEITTKGISYWYGNVDALVEPEDIQAQLDDLRVPIEQHFYMEPGVFFNHVSFFLQKNIDKLLVSRVMQTIESA